MGKYQDATGQTSCVDAPAGSFVSAPGASSATPCAAGEFQSVTGHIYCNGCGPGYYQPAPGQAACIPAPAGFFVSAFGASSATPCAAGTYQDATGGASCTVCPENTVQPATGQAACIPIPKAATAIVIDATTTPDTIYAGIDTAGVYKSTDNTTWSPANGGGANTLANLRVKALTRSSSGILCAATYGGGVFKTSDGGANWSACSTVNLTNLNVVSLTIDAGGKLYAGTEAGVFVSSDGCSSWTAMDSGLP